MEFPEETLNVTPPAAASRVHPVLPFSIPVGNRCYSDGYFCDNLVYYLFF